MASTKLILLTLSSFVLFVSLPLSAISQSQDPPEDPSLTDVDKMCGTLPHPEPCKFFMSQKSFKPKDKTEFRKMVVELALDQAQAAQRHAWRWGHNCNGHEERAAWTDCVRLYNHTVIQLNQTLQGLDIDSTNTSTYNSFDTQTWLSSALTNLETCKGGSEDLNVTRLVWPHFEYYVSDLISNGLAVNRDQIKEDNFTSNSSSTTHEDYPSWVSHKDRRLLLSSRRVLAASRATFIVAKDNTGHYKTIQAAIDAAARSGITRRKVIHVRKGVYRENIYVSPDNNDITLVGEGMRYTIVTGSRSVRSGYTTYNSATAGIDGLRFIARDITFRNTAGPDKGQAVALRSSSDLSVFYKCAFIGYQDTLFVHSQRQFYKMCYIYGTIDIIFGNAAVVFQSCIIKARRPQWGQMNVITAQGRADPNQNTGIVIQSSRIIANRDFVGRQNTVQTYLGRPWQQYSRTIIMKTYFGPLIHPLGWLEWNGNRFLDTLYYAEYRNFGPGSNVRSRVKWGGVHVITSPTAASKFTVGSFIAGSSWLPSTGVPYSGGL